MFYHHDQCAILSPFYSESLLPKAHSLLLVAIAFSSIILLNPNPHTDLLYTAALEDIQILPEPSAELTTDSAVDEPATEVIIKTSQRLAPAGSEQNRLQGFSLKTQRKTRSKETQFIDHPMFGLIVRITPVKTS